MTSTQDNADINDIFDNILLSEDNINQAGFQEGFEDGLKKGEIEGYHLGYHRGAQVGHQIGYFRGFIQVLLNEKQVEGKVQQNVEKMKKTLDEFPSDNSEEVDIIAALENIKGLYKIICNQLKISSSLPDNQDLSF